MLNEPDELLIKEFHASRLIVAGLDIVRTDVDGCDPLLREDLHLELELVVCDAEQTGLTEIYTDAVRILERMADLAARGGFRTDSGRRR